MQIIIHRTAVLNKVHTPYDIHGTVISYYFSTSLFTTLVLFGCPALYLTTVIFLYAAKKTLRELRKLFFMLKDKVFANARLGFAYNSSVLDDILQGTFGTDMCMNEVIKPR